MFSANSSQVSDDKLFVEDVFSTYLYTGNNGTQTITNGIDLAGKGGLVWGKARNDVNHHNLVDTVRGANSKLFSSLTNAAATTSPVISSFNSNGFTLTSGDLNIGGTTFASWTFREAPKFFDVVTWTGNGTTQLVSHNLGVTPGFVIYKATSTTSNWFTLARGSDGNYTGLKLNLNNQADFIGFPASIVGLTSTTFNPSEVYGNTDGVQYVAYLYAHDAASDGIIQCGSYTGNGSASGPVINLGWEPQWLMVKNASAANTNWQIIDNMRGMPVGSADATLQANLANAESSVEYVSPTATGFQVTSGSAEVNTNASTYIYIAIRRGPMRTPTLGTSVFSPTAPASSVTSGGATGIGFSPDMVLAKKRGAVTNWFANDRLRGSIPTADASVPILYPNLTDAETNSFPAALTIGNTALYGGLTAGDGQYSYQFFRRAPGFMDVVCRTGNGTYGSKSHGLGVVPELIIEKARTFTSGLPDWVVWQPSSTYVGYLNLSVAFFNNGSSPATATTYAPVLDSPSSTYVAYLFASAPGVSKVGSYTGNGSSQTINCGFAAGARFVMIKRTDSTGDWYVWDTARGIVAANDPHLSLNTTAAEVTTDDSVDADSSGFVVNQVAATNVNVNAATYIYLAIA